MNKEENEKDEKDLDEESEKEEAGKSEKKKAAKSEEEASEKPKATKETPEIPETVETPTLEEITEAPQPATETTTDNFSEFMLSETAEEMPTATLPPSTETPAPATPAEPENLEDSAASSIGTPMPSPAAATEEVDYETRVYNEPDYAGSMSEEKALAEMRRRRVRTVEEAREVGREAGPRVMIEDFDQLRDMIGEEREGRKVEEYALIEPERRQEERKLPFEQQRKYREMKRGK